MDAGAKSPQGAAIGDVMYTVKVTTDAGKKSGTDANVSIQMTGANGSSGVYVLAKKNAVNKKQNLFESGQTDDFELGPIAKLGKISKIHVASDGHKGLTHVFSTDWVCESIEIVEGDGTSSFTFNCDQKFSKKESMAHDFKVSDVQGEAAAVTPKPPRASKSALKETIRRGSGTPKASPAATRRLSQAASSRDSPRTARKSKTKRGPKDPAEVTYLVTTFTANEKKAGTDANIEVVINGDKAKSGQLKLDKSQNRNKFEKGKDDKFKFPSTKFCGRLKEIKLTSDNARGASHTFDTQWLCDRVEVVEDRGGGKKKTYTFTNSEERWLSKNKGLSMSLKVDSADDDDDDDDYVSGSRSAAGVFSDSELSEH